MCVIGTFQLYYHDDKHWLNYMSNSFNAIAIIMIMLLLIIIIRHYYYCNIVIYQIVLFNINYLTLIHNVIMNTLYLFAV